MSHSLACDGDADTFAAVALVPAIPGKDLLTYRVADADRGRVRPGMRVLVPLGRRRETGVVVDLAATAPAGLVSIRAIAEVLDSDPILTPELFALCRWAADYYVTTLADVLAAALPGGLRASSTRIVRLATPDAPVRGLEKRIVAHLAAAGPTNATTLARALADRRVATAIRALVDRGILTVEDRLRAPAARTRFATAFTLVRVLADEEAAALGTRAPRQGAVYQRLRAAVNHRLPAADLAVAERAAAGALVRRGVVAATRHEHYRDGGETPTAAPSSLTLTDEQRAAVDAIVARVGFQVFLLHGVTGSGKTEVYLQAAARVHAAGQSVLFLVPEIALTHQLMTRVHERFGAGVAVLHSALGPGERWDAWRKVARGEARIVVGARSALFAPLSNLGLVVVDEEHDAAYKQDEGLRYNARDLAIVRAKLAGAGAILGSATPSVESYQQALDGKYRLLSLPTRVAGRPLPAVEILDLRDAVRPAPQARDGEEQPSSQLLSTRLLDAMAATLARGEQTLLFLNRRGFARALQCIACGEPAGCPSCSVSLTLHERRAVLLCHHCGYARPARAPCAHCGRATLRASIEGTERIEAEITERFPDARVGRLDRDTTSNKGAHRRILDAWSAGHLDVLIGTQMVAKGHDVHAVTLVGVLLADVALNMPDFRAAERAFQLLTQVAGRAGRGDRPGRVIVQTYRPGHHSLVAAAAHDYASFAPRELALRRELAYPPFGRLVILRLEGVDAEATERAAIELAERGRRLDPAVTLRGPAPAPLERLRNRYRWQILLGATSVRALHGVVRAMLVAWRAAPAAREIRLVVDVDPVSML